MTVEQLLRRLREPGLVQLASPESLVEKVEKESRTWAHTFLGYRFQKRPRVYPAEFLPSPFHISPLEVLRQVGVATTFYGHSPFTGIAQHWAQLRYCATLTTKQGVLSLSHLGNEVVHHHKVAQSEYLGIGFALAVAQEALRRQYRGWEFSPIDADYALDRGIPEVGDLAQVPGTTKRPDYFLVGRRTDGRGEFKVVVLECKGTHDSGSARLTSQLSKACTQVRSVELEGQTMPSLMIASQFLSAGVKVSVIDPPGESDLWDGDAGEWEELLAEELDSPPEFFRTRTPTPDELMTLDENRSPDEEEQPPRLPPSDLAEHELGLPQVVTIPQAARRWFTRVLVRTCAASVLAFAGDGETAARFRVPRPYTGPDGGQDALPVDEDLEIKTSQSFSLPGGGSAQGTRLTMPLPDGRQLQVFRGIEERAYEELGNERLGSYFRRAQSAWAELRRATTDNPIAVGRDGTVVMLKVT